MVGAEFARGRVGQWPSLLGAEFVRGRDVPESCLGTPWTKTHLQAPESESDDNFSKSFDFKLLVCYHLFVKIISFCLCLSISIVSDIETKRQRLRNLVLTVMRV